MIYGGTKTWHQTTEVNVELDEGGKVVSVWFRCMPLPFTQTVVGDDRAESMRKMYATTNTKEIIAVEIREK